MRGLADYLDLTVEEAREQWRQILRRTPRPRQEHFTPVEVVLCYGLFYVVDPHRYGGGTIDRAPEIVHRLAELFVRPPGSITSKMMNLDGSRANAAAHEWRFFVHLALEPGRFEHLYTTVMQAARELGVTSTGLPDFLSIEGGGDLELLGQEELTDRARETVVVVSAAKRRADLLASEAETMRLVEQAVRLGQHRFAHAVLVNYHDSCGFCGFSPRTLPGSGLLRASHIKPWAVSDDRERLDPRNGVAACPTHDAAFDGGLITVNGGLRIHRAPSLQESARRDPGVEQYFGEAIKPALLMPAGAERPGDEYLRWHNDHVYLGKVA
ncbi:MAG: HNH endonuclease [Acidimicrobiales bacterium]|nr:HNH endonuclease [Acidimicrobiales bacterium]